MTGSRNRPLKHVNTIYIYISNIQDNVDNITKNITIQHKHRKKK